MTASSPQQSSIVAPRRGSRIGPTTHASTSSGLRSGRDPGVARLLVGAHERHFGCSPGRPASARRSASRSQTDSALRLAIGPSPKATRRVITPSTPARARDPRKRGLSRVHGQCPSDHDSRSRRFRLVDLGPWAEARRETSPARVSLDQGPTNTRALSLVNGPCVATHGMRAAFALARASEEGSGMK